MNSTATQYDRKGDASSEALSDLIKRMPAGTPVRISDGTPRPPLRFSKKVSAWRRNNFIGVVVGHDPHRGGSVNVETTLGSSGRFYSHVRIMISLVDPHKVEIIENLPAVAVEGVAPHDATVKIGDPSTLRLEAFAHEEVEAGRA